MQEWEAPKGNGWERFLPQQVFSPGTASSLHMKKTEWIKMYVHKHSETNLRGIGSMCNPRLRFNQTAIPQGRLNKILMQEYKIKSKIKLSKMAHVCDCNFLEG